jgi:hypothetical protein
LLSTEKQNGNRTGIVVSDGQIVLSVVVEVSHFEYVGTFARRVPFGGTHLTGTSSKKYEYIVVGIFEHGQIGNRIMIKVANRQQFIIGACSIAEGGQLYAARNYRCRRPANTISEQYPDLPRGDICNGNGHVVLPVAVEIGRNDDFRLDNGYFRNNNFTSLASGRMVHRFGHGWPVLIFLLYDGQSDKIVIPFARVNLLAIGVDLSSSIGGQFF